MQHRLSVINASIGGFTTETINNREHIVTKMLSIEGDSVMNEIFYPNNIVSGALNQLDMLPAPADHPNIDGQPVSAFNPLAINANNFGGFVRNPIQDGKKIINELVIDVEVANKHTKGIEIVRRIKNKERIGVSTGLIASLNNKNGTNNGKKFSSTVDAIQFDHVAVLLDNAPAGDNTYTLNHGAVKDKNEDFLMNELKIDLTPLAEGDRAKLVTLNANSLLALVNKKIERPEVDEFLKNQKLVAHATPADEIKTYIDNKDQFTEFVAEKDGFKAFKENQKAEKTKLVEFLVKNSKMTKEQLENMEQPVLKSLADSVVPENDFSVTNSEIDPNDNNGFELIDLDQLQNELKKEG